MNILVLRGLSALTGALYLTSPRATQCTTYSTTVLHLKWHWWITSKEDTEGGEEDRDGRKKEKVVTEKDR